MIPETELVAWEQLCQAATAGPWRRGDHTNGYDYEVFSEAGRYIVCSGSDEGGVLEPADAAFIAAARDALPRLLAEVRQMRDTGDGA